jgi:hypothetical protein
MRGVRFLIIRIAHHGWILKARLEDRIDAGDSLDLDRPRTVLDWTRTLTHRLSLREFIRTTPVKVGGVTVYIEAEPVATRQRQHSTSQLTFAFAPDRVVVLGVF